MLEAFPVRVTVKRPPGGRANLHALRRVGAFSKPSNIETLANVSREILQTNTYLIRKPPSIGLALLTVKEGLVVITTIKIIVFILVASVVPCEYAVRGDSNQLVWQKLPRGHSPSRRIEEERKLPYAYLGMMQFR